jgi:hypothetical protein
MDWSKPVREFRSAFNTHDMEASFDTAVSAFDILLPDNPSAEAIMLRHQVLGLSRAASHRSTSVVNTVCANFEVGAAAVMVFSNAVWGRMTSTSCLQDEMEL